MEKVDVEDGAPALLFSETDEALRQVALDFSRPFADDYLRVSQTDELPWDYFAALADADLLAIGAAEEFGGQGASRVQLGLVIESLAYHNFYLAQSVFIVANLIKLLGEGANQEIKDRWLPELVAGRAVFSLGVTEPGVGSDAANMTTRAVKVDGGWRITGAKTSITWAPHAQAHIIFAKTEPSAGPKGISAFFVPADTPGVSLEIFHDVGWKPVGRAGIGLDEVFVPEANMIGPLHGAFSMVMNSFDLARTLIGLKSVALAQRGLDLTRDYIKTRPAFGRRVSDFQGVTFPLAEHLTKVEAARLLAYKSLALLDAGRSNTSVSAMVKWWAPQVAQEALRECIGFNGHGAYSTELPFYQLLTDVTAFQLADGTAQIQKLIISRAYIGREGV